MCFYCTAFSIKFDRSYRVCEMAGLISLLTLVAARDCGTTEVKFIFKVFNIELVRDCPQVLTDLVNCICTCTTFVGFLPIGELCF